MEKVKKLQMALMNFSPVTSVIERIDSINDLKVDIVDGIHYILGYPVYCPALHTSFPYGLPTYDVIYLCDIESEIDLCQNGYKKVTPGSSKDFDGGYKYCKLWLKNGKAFKITLLTPTQAEFDKDECSVKIRPYPFYEGHVIGTSNPNYFGVYSENDELRHLLFDSGYRGDLFEYDSEEIIGKDFPVMNLLRIQRFGGTFSIYLLGKRIQSSTLLYRAYRDMMNAGDKYPHLFKIRSSQDVIVDMEYLQ